MSYPVVSSMHRDLCHPHLCHPVSTWSYTPRLQQKLFEVESMPLRDQKKGCPTGAAGAACHTVKVDFSGERVTRQFGLGPLGHGFLGWTTKDPKSVVVCQCLSVACPWGPLSTKLYWFQFISRLQLLFEKTRGPSKGIDWMHVSPQCPHKSPPWIFLWRWFLLWKSIRFGAMVYYGILYKLGSQLELRIEWDPVGHSWLLVLFPFSFAIYFWEWWARRCAYVILIRPKWGHRTF
jgi:hypothetical protein